MKVEVKLDGVENVLNVLRSLPPEVVSKRGGPVKSSLAKGARYLRDRAKERLAAVVGTSDESTGLLLDNVIASRGKEPRGSKGERYLVRVRRKAYDGAKLGKRQAAGDRVTTHKTAALLEYGSSHQPQKPWLRPTVAAEGGQVINIVTTDLLKQIDRAVARLRREGRL